MPINTDTPQIDYSAIDEALQSAKNDEALFRSIVNTPFLINKVQMNLLFLGIIVLLQVNKKQGTIDRVALSDTELAKNTTDVSVVPFEEIKIPINDTKNCIAKTIRSGKPQDTTDWMHLFTPVLTPEQARINQASAGIAYSVVYPVKARDGGALIFSYFQYQGGLGDDQQVFMEAYSKIVANTLVNFKRL